MFIRRPTPCAPFWCLDFHRLCSNTFRQISLSVRQSVCVYIHSAFVRIYLLYFSTLSTQDSGQWDKETPGEKHPGRFLRNPLGFQGYFQGWQLDSCVFLPRSRVKVLWFCLLLERGGSGQSWTSHGEGHWHWREQGVTETQDFKLAWLFLVVVMAGRAAFVVLSSAGLSTGDSWCLWGGLCMGLHHCGTSLIQNHFLLSSMLHPLIFL